MTGIIVLEIILFGAALLIFILLTEGRFFGRRIVRFVYDRFGPALFAGAGERSHWRSLARWVDLHPNGRVLDLGTALGDLPRSLAAAPAFGGLAVGLDWSPRMIARAAEAAAKSGVGDRTAFLVQDLSQGLPFRDGTFDVIVCLGLLESLNRPEEALAEIVRALAPDGKLVVSVYSGFANAPITLREAWYRQKFAALGLAILSREPLRNNYDILIAQVLPRD